MEQAKKQICPYAGTTDRCEGCYHAEKHWEVNECGRRCENAVLVEGTPSTCVDAAVVEVVDAAAVTT